MQVICSCIEVGVCPQTGRLTACTKSRLLQSIQSFLGISTIVQMNGASVALLLFSISLDTRRGHAFPNACYTCQSLLDSSFCGEGFHIQKFLAKHCLATQIYCLKIIETAGRQPMVYRKCSSYNCEQEAALRKGSIHECNVCTSSLCNEGYAVGPTTSPLLVLYIFLFQIPTYIFY